MKTVLGLVAVAFSFAVYGPYFFEIWKKTAKPHVFSWVTWAILTGLGFVLSLGGGGGIGAWVFAVQMALNSTIAVYAFFRGEKNITRADWLAFSSAIAITVFYIFTRNAVLSVILAASIDFLGFLPTYRKSFLQPRSEPALTYSFALFSFLLSIFALQNYSFVTVFYPLTLVATNGAFVAFLLVRRKMIPKIAVVKRNAWKQLPGKSLLVTSYVNPDLDGAACVFAYSEFLNKTGTNAEAGIIDEPQEEAKYLFDRFAIEWPRRIANDGEYQKVILVDASEPGVFGDSIAPEKVVEIVDHRQAHEAEKFPNAKVQIELVGAAATLIAEKFFRENVAISKQAATLLFGAIVSNTLNFRSSTTTNRDIETAARLNEIAGLPENFWRELFAAKSDLAGPKLEKRMIEDLAEKSFGAAKVGIAQIEMIGAERLVEERQREILDVLNKLQTDLKLDFIFLNTVELEQGFNILVSGHESTKRLLEKILNLKFDGDAMKTGNFIMRKQLFPLLKTELEKNVDKRK